MKSWFLATAAAVLLLSACAGHGNTQMYGEVKGGVESSHTSIGR